MSRPWMPLYVGDYLADTRRLSTLEHGAYLLLIMDYWQNGSIPTEDAALARIAGLPSKEWEKAKKAISPLFQDGWRHKRIDTELARAEDKSKSAKASAAASWNSPKRSERISERSANAYANAETPDGDFDENSGEFPLSVDKPTVPDELGHQTAKPLKENGTTDANALRSQSEGICGQDARARVLQSQSHKDSDFGGDLRSSDPPASPIPRATAVDPNASPSEAELAAATAAGLTPAQALSEWQAFVDFNLAKAERSFNWPASWRKWLHNGKKFERPEQARKGSIHDAARNIHEDIARRSAELYGDPALLPSPRR